MGLIRKTPLIPDGLVGKWMLGDGLPLAQRGTVIDLSGQGNHAAAHGNPALWFDGGTDRADVATPWDMFTGNPKFIRIAFAIKITEINGSSTQTIAEFLGSGSDVFFKLVYVEDGNHLVVYADTTAGGGGTLRSVTVCELTPGIWQHVEIYVMASRTAGSVSSWINGVAQEGWSLGAMDHAAFQAGDVPSQMRFGLDSSSANPLKALIGALAFGGVDAPPGTAQGFYDSPQNWLTNCGLAAWYRCNEAAGNPQDGSGNGHHLALTDVTWDTGANLGNAWLNRDGAGDSFNAGGRYMDGVNDYFSVPNHSDLVFGTGDYQIHVWFKSTATFGFHGSLLCKGNKDVTGWAFRLLVGGRAHFECAGGTVVLYTDAPPTQPDFRNALHLFSVLKDTAANKAVLCVDGVQYKQDTSANCDLSDASDIKTLRDVEYPKGDFFQIALARATKTIEEAVADTRALFAQGPYR